jgi:hypothetical protein
MPWIFLIGTFFVFLKASDSEKSAFSVFGGPPMLTEFPALSTLNTDAQLVAGYAYCIY